MRDESSTILGIKSGEGSIVSMLLTQCIFLGIFMGAFDITAHSLLLSTFDEKMMARGYIVSGITGIILTWFYSWLLQRVKFTNFAVLSLITLTVVTFFLWAALFFSPANWIIFLTFIMLGPLNITALMVFWGTADRLFSGSQGNRLFRIADAGMILGIVIISFAITVMMSLKTHSGTILLFSTFPLVISAIIQLIIGKHLSLIETGRDRYEIKHENKKTIYAVFREDHYFKTLAIFAALSVLAALFIQYMFMAATRKLYPLAEDMEGFLGLFTGSMMIFILIVKLFIFPYILRYFGLRTCIVISPVLIAVFTIILVVTGLYLGYSPEATSGFMVLFLLLGVARLISKSLRESVEFPSLKVIYQSIDIKVKSEIQSVISGTVNELAVFTAGFILTIMGLFSFIRLIHFSWFLFIIVIIWLFAAFRLFLEYRKSIITGSEKTIGEESAQDISDKPAILKNKFSSGLDFRTDYFRLISGDFSVLDENKNKSYFEVIINSAGSTGDINLLPALKKISNNISLDEEIRHNAEEITGIIQRDLRSLTSDNEKIDLAKKALSGSRIPQTTEILRLLRDNSIESKKLGIYMIGKFRLADLLSEVCACLNIAGMEKDAYEVLKSFGPAAEVELIRFYLITSGNAKSGRTILQLLGHTCNKETTGFLFSRLWSNSRQLKEIIVKYLLKCKFKPSEEEKLRLNQLISEVIGSIAWNLSAKISLKRSNDKFLHEVISRETERWNRFLFDLLSIIYNSGSIAAIRKNFAHGTMENVAHAIEMTDILVSDSIKQKLIYLLEVIPDEDKVRKLFQFYPGEILARKKLFEDIINRDYNLVSLWTKACTLRSIEKIEYKELAESVTALLFSPEELIQEESANLIGRSNPELYFLASARIPYPIKTRLDKILNRTKAKEEFLFEKMLFLSERIGVIADDDLLPLAVEMRYIKNSDTSSGLYSDPSIVWPLAGENRNIGVHIAYNEMKEGLITKYSGVNNLSFYILPLSAVEEYHFQFPEKSFQILKYIDINEEQ